MRKIMVGLAATVGLFSPLAFVGTAAAEGPVFYCYKKDEGPGSSDFAVVPSAEYPNKSDAKKAFYVRCFAQGHQGG